MRRLGRHRRLHADVNQALVQALGHRDAPGRRADAPARRGADPSAMSDDASERAAMDAAAAAVQAWATRPAFEPDATVNAHRAGLGACYGAAARLEFAGSLNVDATTAAELAAEAELEARVAACAARERRCHDFREEVEACLGTLARVGSCRDEAGAKAAEVTSACDAILDAQRALVVEAEKYDDALGDLEPVAPARLARVSAEAADDVEDFEAAVRELEGKLARVDARRARGAIARFDAGAIDRRR